MLTFFRNLSFTDSELNGIIGKAPQLVVYDPEKTLLPKLDFFKFKGASSSDLVKIINGGPRFLYRSLRESYNPQL